MRRLLFLFVPALFISAWCMAQQTTAPNTQQASQANCTQVLRLARAVYEQGRLHELETLLKGCLDGEVGSANGFATTQEKVDAYRFLCLSFIYLEEPAKADTAMLKLLQTDHFFSLNPTDPAEFQALYRTFRSEPRFSFGFKAGANLTMAHIQKNYYVFSESPKQGKYSPGISLSIGGFAEKEFFPNKSDKNPLKWTTLRFEAFFNIRSFTIKYPQLAIYTSDPGLGSVAATFDGKAASNWIDLNLILRYRYNHRNIWDPYFGLGPGVSILLSSKINQAKLQRSKLVVEGSTASTTTSDSYSGPAVDIKPAYNPLAYSVSAVWGVNRRFGAFYINAELRYQYGLNNLINPKNRTVDKFVPVYGVTLNDYNQSNIVLGVGITVPNFKPKKLSKRK